MLWSVAVRAGARPDEIEGLAIFIGEQAGEDRRVEAGIVELDRKIVAAFLAGLIPMSIDQNPCAHWRSPMDMMRQG